jgi:addiction module HigA family antidote
LKKIAIKRFRGPPLKVSATEAKIRFDAICAQIQDRAQLAADVQVCRRGRRAVGLIGISRVMLSRVLHGRAAVSADMHLRLAEALGTTPGYWLALQTQRDWWTTGETAKERKKIKCVAVPELETA